MHRLGFQIAVKTMCAQLPALAALLDAPERCVKLWEIGRVYRHTPCIKGSGNA